MTLLTIVFQNPSPSPAGAAGAGIFSSPILLSLLIWIPVLAAAAIATMPNPRGRYDTLMKQIAFFTNLGLVFVLFVAYNQFENFLPTMQYEEKLDWLPAIGVKYHLGVDGAGLVMLVLSGLIGIASVLGSLGVRERVRSYFCLLLLAQASVNGAIVARDMFVLLVFWGASVVPLALLIIGWGGPRRVAAAWRLVGYWGLGPAALAVGVLGLYAASGGQSFDGDVLLKASLSPRIQIAISVVMIIAAATRLPLFPFHGWIRDVLSEAPPGVTVVVAGAASRLGAFLLLRTVIGAEPAAGHLLSPLLAALALLGVPILSSYTAEVMTFFGAFKNQPIGAFAVAAGLAVSAIALAVLLRRVLLGAPNTDAPGVSDASLGETWFLGLLAGALLWVGLFPGGPKIPGTDVPLFDPGLLNQMSAGISEDRKSVV